MRLTIRPLQCIIRIVELKTIISNLYIKHRRKNDKFIKMYVENPLFKRLQAEPRLSYHPTQQKKLCGFFSVSLDKS